VVMPTTPAPITAIFMGNALVGYVRITGFCEVSTTLVCFL